MITENTLSGKVAEAVRGLEQVQQELADTRRELGEEQCLCHAMEEQANRRRIYSKCLLAIIKLQALFRGTLKRRSTSNEVSMDYVPPSVPISPPRGVHLQPILPPTPVAYNEGTTANEVQPVTPYALFKDDDYTTVTALSTMVHGVANIEEIQSDLTSAVRELFPHSADESTEDDSISRSVEKNSSDDEEEEKEEEEEPDEDNDTTGSRGDFNPDNDPDDPPDPGSGDGTSPSGGGNPDCTEDAIDPPADAQGGDDQSQSSNWSSFHEDLAKAMAMYRDGRTPATTLPERVEQCNVWNAFQKVCNASAPTGLCRIGESRTHCQPLTPRDHTRHQRRGFRGTWSSLRQTRGRSSKKTANNSDRCTIFDGFSYGKKMGDISFYERPTPLKPTQWAQLPPSARRSQGSKTKKKPTRKSSRSKGHSNSPAPSKPTRWA